MNILSIYSLYVAYFRYNNYLTKPKKQCKYISSENTTHAATKLLGKDCNGNK